jgi:hypothetical protein
MAFRNLIVEVSYKQFSLWLSYDDNRK